jgi:hypothetical protein
MSENGAMAGLADVTAEIRGLFTGRVSVADGILPPLLFVTVNSVWGLTPAALAGAGVAVGLVGWRLGRRRPLRFALAGLGGTLLAAGFALRSGSATGYFLPGIISGGLTTLLILVSILARRPLVAWTSWLTRGWPIDWYWHPRVMPAYIRTSWLWVGFFGLRTTGQWWLFTSDRATALGLVRVLTGWPALLLLLVATYLLGRRWLADLEGPSVEEFEADAPPPWSGQAHGF